MYPFPECTSISVTGATLGGKTSWVFRLLCHKDEMFISPPEKVLYCYGIYQPLFEQMEKEFTFITFHYGLPSEENLNGLSDETICNLVVLDGLMESVTSSGEMAKNREENSAERLCYSAERKVGWLVVLGLTAL